MNALTIEQLEKDRDDLRQQLEQVFQAEAQAARQRLMIEGALQLVQIQIARLNPAEAAVAEAGK